MRPSIPRRGTPRGLRGALTSVGVASLVALLLLGFTSATAVGATLEAPKCDYVHLRTGPSTTYAIKATVMTSARVSAVLTVSGGSYTSLCAGVTVSGSHWLKISAVNGHSTSSLYGVSYVYGASGLFKAVTVVAPTASPTASPTHSPAPTTALASPVASASPGAGPSASPAASPDPTASPDPSALPSASPSSSPSPSPTPTPTPAACANLPSSVTCLTNATEFFGRGYGHGVGLSQYGAKGRASAGQSAATIVAHYYPGTALGSMANNTIRVLVLSSFAASSSAPLRLYGRFGTWTVDGLTGTFPADAELLGWHDTSVASGWRLKILATDGTVLFNGPSASASFRVRPGSGTILQLYSKPTYYDHYRGILRVIGSTTGTVNVVNEVSMESYLRGVVGTEMSASWPLEALKSQAIASRSYAAYRLHPGSGTYDIYDDTRSQVYHGYLGEHAASTSAVTGTAGKVVTYGGAIANTLYHSADGGWTENNENVFTSSTGAITAGKVAYLRGSSDRAADGSSYDRSSPWATWHTSIYTLAQLQAVFHADSRTNVGSLVALDLSRRGVSGRLISVTLYGANGTTRTVSGAVFISVFNVNTPAADQAMMNTLFALQPIP